MSFLLQRTFGTALLAATMAACTSPVTQLVLAIDTNMVVPSEIDTITLHVASVSTVFDTTVDLMGDHPALPLTLTLVPGTDPNATFTIVATATGHTSQFAVSRTLEATFVDGESRAVAIPLVRACQGIQCSGGANATCTEAGCRSVPSLRDTLPPWPSCVLYNADCNADASDGCETDLRISPVNCGRCNHACAQGAACVDGNCDNERIVGITAGRAHACAVRASGAIVCWGDDGMSQLGPGATAASSHPVTVSGLAAQLAAGDDFTCARRPTGGVACWGSGSAGQLGSATPMPGVNTVALPAHLTAVQIAAGGQFACALASNQQVYCWGANDKNQLGFVGAAPSGITSPVMTAGTTSVPLQSVAAIAAGHDHACAVVTSPTLAVHCWGDDSLGQLGTSAPGAPSLATPVTLGAAILSPVDTNPLAAGGARTCVLTMNGGVTCWGTAEPGGSPAGPAPLIEADTMSPVRAMSIAVGAGNVCGLTRVDAMQARAWCVGANDFGQLGTGTTGAATSATSSVNGPDDIVASACGADFACAARRYGGVVCWGNNASFQGGDSVGSTLLAPDPVASLP